jgi:RimJ/RimL family protein N-acetyltransferase
MLLDDADCRLTSTGDSRFAAETSRLKLRRLHSGDAAFLLELLNQSSWIEFIGDRGVRTLMQAGDYLTQRIEAQFDRYGYGMWGMELPQQSQLAGLAGLVKRDFLPEPDLGFALLDRYAGQGFAFEAATAVLSLARRRGLGRLLAITVSGNQRSIRLLQRLGFELEAAQTVPGEGAPVMRYSKALG